ncbi:hypothetical protein V6N12_058318 [Hibiscus sabdariffa]|uniref:Uncharacterized protein n=1 Tax=Hibiscus sabdariffa TaxID=183260 RepID=A0ABR2ERS5_9ROSI
MPSMPCFTLLLESSPVMQSFTGSSACDLDIPIALAKRRRSKLVSDSNTHDVSLTNQPSMLIVFEDRRRELHTTRSPQFLGLRNQHGLWSDSDYGSDVRIDVFDTGSSPNDEAFRI